MGMIFSRNIAVTRASVVAAPAALAPKLLVVVDTEEEFDWGKRVSRSEMGVTHMRHQDRAQRILEGYGVKPTYVVDYSVASQEQGFGVLREWHDDGLCIIGAHLHPWVNPPYDEEVCTRNSYPGNLPKALERAKLEQLTATIERNFGRRPTVYRAGRYGIGSSTGEILEDLGYEIDTSVVPRTDFQRDGGPDFRAYEADPFWFGPTSKILEIPLTAGWCGYLRNQGEILQPRLMSNFGMRLHLPGVFARLGLFERIRLTPEGTNLPELKRLTQAMLAAGRRFFVFNYHSPSVVPGHTPYVRSNSELQRFLGLIDRFCEFFFATCSGEAATPDEVRGMLVRQRAHVETGANYSNVQSGARPAIAVQQ